MKHRIPRDGVDAPVEDAATKRLSERRRERVYAAYAAAAQDPVFIAEMAEIERAFNRTAVGTDL